jgi:hypothetical protein
MFTWWEELYAITQLSDFLHATQVTPSNVLSVCRTPADRRSRTKDLLSVAAEAAFSLSIYKSNWVEDLETQRPNHGSSSRYTEVLARTLQQVDLLPELVYVVGADSCIAEHKSVAGRMAWGSMSNKGRTMCVTEGQRPCNEMDEVSRGDTIVALQEADTLFVLCPVGSQYWLVGDA